MSKQLTDLQAEQLAMHVSYVSIVVNMVLSVGKIAAGVIGNSAAMISDGIHSASDLFSTFIVMAGIKIAGKKSDADHQYGHEKLEYIAAILLAVLLFLTGLGLGYEGLRSILQQDYEHLKIPSMITLVAAVLSILSKEAMYHYTKNAANKINSGALLADAWHHRSDSLSSIGSFIGIAAAMYGFPIMDSIASLVICIMILYTALGIFRDATDKLVDHACDTDTITKMIEVIISEPGVLHLDSLQTRMFGSKIYVDIEISADGQQTLVSAHEIAERVHHSIEHSFPTVKHCMVHVNPKKVYH